MKRIATTAGFLALGAASMYGIYAPELTRIETTKPWTVAASLRGFYDSNWALIPNWEPLPKSSWGMEIRPFIGLNLPMEQSYLGFSYLGDYRWYDDRTSASGQTPWDFANQVDIKFDHQFSSRYRLKVNDSFLYALDPDVNTGDVVTLPLRADQGYFRNLANVNFTAELTPELGVSITYNNLFYNYNDSGPYSYAATLNRVVQQIPIDFRWQVQPDLVALVGYAYGNYDYTGGELISGLLPSNSRNAQNHTIYLGADYDITPELRAALRAGAQYNMYEYYSGQDQWTPYVDLQFSYYYTVGSHLDLGVRNSMAATDVATAQDGVPTLSQEATAVYMAVNHQFTPKITGTLTTMYQWSSFHGGAYNDAGEGLLLLGIYGAYRFNQYVSFEAGYNYDLLNSDINFPGTDLPARSFFRNFFYFGVRAQY